jgi:hypothetical protein
VSTLSELLRDFERSAFRLEALDRYLVEEEEEEQLGCLPPRRAAEVGVELQAGTIAIRARREVALYRDRFEALWRLGVAGDELVALVREIGRWLGRAQRPVPSRRQSAWSSCCPSPTPTVARVTPRPSYRSVSRPRVIRLRPPSPSDERPELDGLRVNTLTGAKFTATRGIPALPMAGWLSPDGSSGRAQSTRTSGWLPTSPPASVTPGRRRGRMRPLPGIVRHGMRRG